MTRFQTSVGGCAFDFRKRASAKAVETGRRIIRRAKLIARKQHRAFTTNLPSVEEVRMMVAKFCKQQ